ncbi:hypothetical protein ZHAS_00019195 [Anopheles sinensis]|uniref:Uncharacterized protein n=1 Tax=Anopheles sinensis TaxID=74873 RepID=A0A084WLN9_ANOSI|nr:hypothetical protein ZHAS_00019195 [Anopheles sinensis]
MCHHASSDRAKRNPVFRLVRQGQKRADDDLVPPGWGKIKIKKGQQNHRIIHHRTERAAVIPAQGLGD